MEQSINRHGLSRRQFLQVTGGVSLVALLAACAPGGAAAPASGGAASAPAAQGAEDINFLVRPDIRSAYAADAAVEAWSKDHEAKVKVDIPAGAADTKIQAAMAAGDLPWDGFAVIEGPWAIESWVTRGLVQPLDDLIAVSKEPDAAKVVPAIIPSVLESSKYQGKQYTVPGNVGSVALGWFWAPLKKAQIDPPPTTWDEVRAAAEKIKATSPDLTPFDSAGPSLCDQVAMIWGATKTPLTKDGLIDWQSDESVAALEWQQKMVKDGLMPAVHTDSFNNWLKGGTAIMTSYDVHGTMAQQAFGVDAATTGLNITKVKGDPAAGAPFWLNGSVVLQKAANAQGMMDFLLWWFGPSNKATGKQISTVAAKPAYQYTYDEFIKPDPVQKWQLDGIELVRNSVPFPSNLYWNTQDTAAIPWLQKAVDPANNLSAEDALAGIVKDVQDQISKMKS